VSFGLGTFARQDRVFPGLVLDERRVIDLAAAGFPPVRTLLERWDESLERLAAIAESGDHESLALESLRVLPPVEPGQILQSGANYRTHVIDLIVAQGIGSRPGMSEEELREEGARVMDSRAASGEPYLFLGTPSSLCGAYDDVVLPPESEQHDWELELAAVIGRPGRRVPAERALELVAGYTICNDLTTRDRVFRDDVGRLGADWVRSKSAPTFLPTGPWIVPAQFIRDPQDLQVTLRLNGEVMQDESTADMIYGVAQLVSYASSCVQLRPGDLVLTGSPSGNGAHWGRFLREGDVMEGEITGLGRQRNRCVAEEVGA
jgi:2,4-diketo-3-deoxy-L-fuconate hydrolase